LRTTKFFLLIVIISGCQTIPPPAEVQPLQAPPQRLPATVATKVALQAQQQQSAVKPVTFEEPVAKPMPEPETLPSTAIKADYEYSLTLSDLERMALAANPSVSRAKAMVEAARGNWVQVGLPFNPSAGYEGQQLGSLGLAEQHGVYVSQEFVRGGKLQLNRNVAAQQISKAEAELAAQEQRVLTDVRKAFNQVLIAQQQAKLTVELQDIAAKGMKTADALMKGKEVGMVDLMQAQLEFENADILVQNAHNRSRAAWQILTTVVGDPGLAPQPLQGDIETEHPLQEYSATLERLLTSSPEIAVARAEIERARWAAERARVEKTPNLMVQGLMNWQDNGIGGRPDGAIQVGVPLPLWNRNQGAMVQASQEAAAAERALDQLELELQRRLAPVYERYANALNQVEKYRTRILPTAKESVQLVHRSYEAGETGYINLLTAQRTYSQTNLNYLDSLSVLREAEAEIEGLLLTNSLENR
jgi:outer membrane protein, heavy metal efflux system